MTNKVWYAIKFNQSTKHYLELVYRKNYFHLAKILVLKFVKMIVNQADCFRLEKSSVIKSLLPEKCKPYEIYRRMCDVCGEARCSKKKINGINMGSPQRSWVEKTIYGVKIFWLSGKEKVPDAVISKEGHIFKWQVIG